MIRIRTTPRASWLQGPVMWLRRFLQVAIENGVAIYHDDSAATLLARLELGQEIPPSFTRSLSTSIYRCWTWQKRKKIKRQRLIKQQKEKRKIHRGESYEDSDTRWGYHLPGVWNNRSFDEFGEVTVFGRTPDELAAERIGTAELAVTESTKIDRDVLDRCTGLKWIGVLGTGYDHVDAKYAEKRGSPYAIARAIPPNRWHSTPSRFYSACATT
jgi:type III secretion system FlhB-like substrate exporter